MKWMPQNSPESGRSNESNLAGADTRPEHGSPDAGTPGAYRGRERRRASWSAFRKAYPTFVKVAAAIFLMLVIANLWLGYRRHAYGAEIERLRSGMTDAEREKTDLVIRSEKDQLRMAVELARRQARWDPELHLSIAVDSHRMYLERDGAMLRDMRVAIVPATMPGSDTAIAAFPRGERTIQEVLRDNASGRAPGVLLTGGLRIIATRDSTVATPGSVRMDPTDFHAILGNLNAGMIVYFY